VGLLQAFDVIFPVIFVFAITFAILQKYKPIGESIGINSIIAIMVGFMVLLSRDIIDIINFTIPWFTIAIIFFILMLLIFRVFGASEESIFSYMQGDKAIGWVIIAISIVIIIAGLGTVLGQRFTEAAFTDGEQVAAADGSVASQNFDQNIQATLFNPKVLGLVILFTIAVFTVALLTAGEK